MNILYESKDFIILNKKSGIHSDQVLKNPPTTLRVLDWVLAHRLDQDTSGCLLFCRPHLEETVRQMFAQHSHQLKKTYLAGLSTDPQRFETTPELVEGFIGSRYRSSKKVRFSPHDDHFSGYHSLRPVSHYVSVPIPGEISDRLDLEGFVHRIDLVSGARHQIRAYFAWLGAPILGDAVYGEPHTKGLQLHAYSLSFQHPIEPNTEISATATEISSL